MPTFDADTMMVCAGVLLSALAFAEVYSTWKKTRRTERREPGPDATDAPEETDRNPPESAG